MSNHLAVATVTATVEDLLKGPLVRDVPGAEVSAVRPNGAGGLPDTGLNLFLYRVTRSEAASNADLPTRTASGRTVSRPRLGLDLHYLLSFYGTDSELQQQRLLGSAVQTLHARPVLSRDRVRDTVAQRGYLAGSNLADEIDLVKLSPLSMSLEELSRLWSVLLQTQYTLSVAYRATVVFIESEESYSSGLPVLSRNVYVEQLRQIVVERVAAAAGDDEPILAEAAIVVHGRGLDGRGARVLVDGEPLPPDPLPVDVVAPARIEAKLPATLRAGLRALQVQHKRRMGTPPEDHPGRASNVAAFLLRPRIRRANGSYEIAVANRTAHEGDRTHSADLAIQVEPRVGGDQRVALALDEAGTEEPQSYTFPALPPGDDQGDHDENDGVDSAEVRFRVNRVKPAEYLVRVVVDGAESPLEMAAGSFSEPKVAL